MNIKKFFHVFRKSPIEKWAEEEVRRAKEMDKLDRTESEYKNDCYKIALRTFKSLLKANPTGVTSRPTKMILDRLINRNPLTPIEDTPDVWSPNKLYMSNGVNAYQCKRCPSLFKMIHPDGTITYHDRNRFCFKYKDDASWTVEAVLNILYEQFPITMPYFPWHPIKVFCDHCLVDRSTGSTFDTIAVLEAELYDDDLVVPINRYFKDFGDEYVEIDEAEYNCRKAMADDREKKEHDKWLEMISKLEKEFVETGELDAH